MRAELATRRMREREHEDRLSVLWRAKWWILALALAAGIAAYGISRFAISPTYSSTAGVVVTTRTVSGGLSDAISASNALAGQYAQLANSPPVLARASSQLPSGGTGLAAAILVGTNQNIVEVSALGGSPQLAQLRANAVANAFVINIKAVNVREAAQLRNSVERQLQSSKNAISRAQASVARATQKAITSGRTRASVMSSVLAAKEALLQSLVTQRQSIISDLAQNSVAAQPSVRMAAVAGPGTKYNLSRFCTQGSLQ